MARLPHAVLTVLALTVPHALAITCYELCLKMDSQGVHENRSGHMPCVYIAGPRFGTLTREQLAAAVWHNHS
jgi:hypothetical protein